MNSKEKQLMLAVGLGGISLILVGIFFITYQTQVSPDSKIINTKNVAVIFPLFTKDAYSENGFYSYYQGNCDKKCLTVPLWALNTNMYNPSIKGLKILTKLNYTEIDDLEIEKNPNIVKRFDTLIVLHNEYATYNEFKAITNHKHVIFLYPNSLYARVSVDEKSQTITLHQGHGYNMTTITSMNETDEAKNASGKTNGFHWKWDNTKFEQNICDDNNWHFYKTYNGWALNCYPESIIMHNYSLLEKLKELT